MTRLSMLGLLFLAAVAPASANNSRPDAIGVFAGAMEFGGAGTAIPSVDFQDFTSDDFTSMTSEAVLTDGRTFTELVLVNDSATVTLHVKYVADGATNGATTHRLKVYPKSSVTLPIYGLQLRTVSLRASGAGLTGFAYAQFVAAGT